MRAVVQRVSRARVVVGGQTVGSIGFGLCVRLLGIATEDEGGDAESLAQRVATEAGRRRFESNGVAGHGQSAG